MLELKEIRKHIQQEFAYLLAITNEETLEMIPHTAALLSIGRIQEEFMRMSALIQESAKKIDERAIEKRKDIRPVSNIVDRIKL